MLFGVVGSKCVLFDSEPKTCWRAQNHPPNCNLLFYFCYSRSRNFKVDSGHFPEATQHDSMASFLLRRQCAVTVVFQAGWRVIDSESSFVVHIPSGCQHAERHSKVGRRSQ